jgi:hypothetical protein
MDAALDDAAVPAAAVPRLAIHRAIQGANTPVPDYRIQ